MDYTALQLTWFILIGVLFTGYFILEGHDFGVGMILPISPDSDRERRQLLATILPTWDGNQVWLITAGASIFAAFPEWYGTLFSGNGFYPALLLILICLIVRPCAFKYRDKVTSPSWKRRWDIVLIAASYGLALLWGVAFANIVQGVAIDADKYVTTSLLGLLNPYALLGGVTFVLAFMLHGAVYASLKTDGDLRVRSRRLAVRISIPTIVVAAAFLVWTQLALGTGWTWIPLVIAALGLVLEILASLKVREGWAYVGTTVAIAGCATVLFGSLFPNVMPATNDPANSLTIANASSTPYTLTVMVVAVCVFLPIVMAYQAWGYWVFRKRVTIDNIEEQPEGLMFRAKKAYRKTFA